MLERLYCVDCLSARAIASQLQVSLSRVYRSLVIHKIPRRRPGTGGLKEAYLQRRELACEAPVGKCMALRNNGEPCDNHTMRGRRYCWVHLNEVRNAG
jgi:hypothetical protein